MAYPSLDQYNQAFQLHSRLLTDAELKTGTVATTGLGLPLALCGGFALTYTISNGSKKFAVRCFHRESKALERRYVAIAKRLAALQSQYFLDFQFQPKGISVDGVGYPIVKMAWAKGETLGEFLDSNRTNGAALAKLSEALVSMGAFLEKECIAHGDLQTGNLMVSGGGTGLQLIDYDGMYVDDIKDIGSAELGHVNFQHPQRKLTNPFTPRLDRFSLIAISVALQALRADATFWDKTKSEVDAILFRANDFADPSSSQAFALLSANASLATTIKNFASVCKSPMDKAPSLADFLAGRHIPTLSVVLAGLTKSDAKKAGYISAYDLLSATDYALCLKHVGDRVEVIGQITDVTEQRARNGKPYVFINFGDWRGRIFKVSIWSEGLAALKVRPDALWIGKWMSVVGLMEPPYSNPKFKYSHLSINVTAIGQMSLIEESDAQWRLSGPTEGIPSYSGSSNQDALDRIKSRAPAGPSQPPKVTSASASSANRAALDKIRAATQPVPTHTTPNAPYVRRTPHISPPVPSASGQQSSAPQQRVLPKEKGVVGKILGWLFG